MLPDLPSYKYDLQSIMMLYFREQVQLNLGVFQQAGKRVAHEGNRMRIIRGDGTVEDSDYKQASSEVSLKFDDIPNLTPADRLRIIDNMAKEMADQMAAHMFDSLNETLEQYGQVVENNGQPLNADTVLRILESIHVGFNDDGTHSPLTLVTGPGIRDVAEKALIDVQTDPALRIRYEEIIAKKRMEWRDREAARKLVG